MTNSNYKPSNSIKMKKALFICVIALLAVTAHAQIKIHQNGQVSLSTISSSLNQGVQFLPNCTFFNSCSISAWSHVSISYPKHVDAKSWIVVNPNTSGHTFFVTGAGVVYYKQLYHISSSSLSKSKGESIGGEEALNTIKQINGYSYPNEDTEIPDLSSNEFVSPDAIESLYENYRRRNLGLNGNEVENILPDAVRADSEGNKCIDYNAIIVILLESVKEQQRQIEELEAVLEENGIVRK